MILQSVLDHCISYRKGSTSRSYAFVVNMNALIIIVVMVAFLSQTPSASNPAESKNIFGVGSKLNLQNIALALEVLAEQNNCTAKFLRDFGGPVRQNGHRRHEIETAAMIRVTVNGTTVETRCSFEFQHVYYPIDEDMTTPTPTAKIYDLYYHNFTLTEYYCDPVDGLYLASP